MLTLSNKNILIFWNFLEYILYVLTKSRTGKLIFQTLKKYSSKNYSLNFI
jgi:hypothetical protein